MNDKQVQEDNQALFNEISRQRNEAQDKLAVYAATISAMQEKINALTLELSELKKVEDTPDGT